LYFSAPSRLCVKVFPSFGRFRYNHDRDILCLSDLHSFAAFALNALDATQRAALEIQPEVVYKSVGLRYGRTPSFNN